LARAGERLPKFQGFTSPFSWSGFKHDLRAAGRDVGATWDNLFSAAKNGGVAYVYAQASALAGYVPLKVGAIPVGAALNGLKNNPFNNVTARDPSVKLGYMDPHQACFRSR
jgi:hypothetical protein